MGDKLTGELTKTSQEKRDELHKRIKELKEKRDLMNQEIKNTAISLNNIRDKYFKSEYRKLSSLNKKIKILEKQQMTSVLSIQEEKCIVRKISEINIERKKIYEKINENKSIEEHKEKIRKLKTVADEYHFLILELSEKATEYHNTINEGD